MQQQITIADILDRYGEDYINRNHIPFEERNLIRLLSACRTQAMGSHYEKCDQCNYFDKAYNSCRNRHCPTCQHKDKLEWVDNRMKELLPVGYYHLVFTIPHELNMLCLNNKKGMYDILFKAASQTILELSADTKHMGANTGLTVILHTWGQNMMEHPHLHCIMPAGGLSFDKQHWVHINNKDDFFIYYKVLSKKFQGKFLDLLKIAYNNGELQFPGKLATIGAKGKFAGFTDILFKKQWVVNIQAPMGNPDKVLEYLSRYVFRIAITDKRIVEVKDGKVAFFRKDNKTKLYRIAKLDIDEFIRRFLLHILPKGFFKVRYYGIFASRYRKKNIELAKQLIELEVADKLEETLEDGEQVWQKQDAIWNEILESIKKCRQPNCPVCKKGRLRFAGIVPKENWETG